LKYSLEVDFLLSLLTIQMGVCIPPPLGEKVPSPISNGPKRIMNLSCSFLSHPIRMGKSPIRT
jgi:hypothetical protein